MCPTLGSAKPVDWSLPLALGWGSPGDAFPLILFICKALPFGVFAFGGVVGVGVGHPWVSHPAMCK